MVKLCILLLFLASRSIAMGYHYEPYDDNIYGDHHRASVFENRAKAWKGLRETEKQQRQEYARDHYV